MPTQLSMDAWVGWQGSVVTHCPTGGDRGRLVLHRLHGKGSSWQFLSSPGPHLSLPGEVIACEVVLDQSRGVRVPCLVTAAGAGAAGEAEVEVLVCSGGRHDSSSLISCGEVSLGNAFSEGSVKVLDGPTVVWREGGIIFLAWPVFGSSGEAMKQHSVAVGAVAAGGSGRDYIINQFWCFTTPGGSILLFVGLQPAGPPAGSSGAGPHSLAGDSRWLCLLLSQKEDNELILKELPPQHHIPSDYGNIAVCIALHHCSCVGRNGSVALSTEALVGTRYQQVVVLRDGCPVHCIAMETIPTELAVLEISGAAFGVTVRTGKKEVMAYKISTTDGPQELCTWRGVEHVLVGDFAHLPREQLLVVFSDSPEEISDFLITDLAQLHIGSEQQTERDDLPQPCADSVTSAVRALQVRKRVGEAHLLDRQRELQQKTHLLHNSLSLLEPLARREMGCGHLPEQDQSLLCVLPGRIEGEHGVSVSGSSPSQPVITGTWQRLLEGQWVVGVVLRNTAKCYLQDPSLALVSESQHMSEEGGGSKAVWTAPGREEDRGHEPAAKRARLEGISPPSGHVGTVSVCPGGEVCLVAWVPLPDLTAHDELQGSLVCRWRWRGEGCGGEEVQVAVVGSVELPVRQVMDGSLSCDSSSLQQWEGSPTLPPDGANLALKDHQDMACYLATYQFTRLRAAATYTDLCSLPELLRARLPLPAEHILSASTAREGGRGGGAKQATQCKDLEGVFLHVTSSTRRAAITVMYRTSATLSLLLAALQSCLPDDVTLSWSSEEGVREIHSCISSLKQEVERRAEEVTVKMKEERGVANTNGMDCSHKWAPGEATYVQSLFHLMQSAEQ